MYVELITKISVIAGGWNCPRNMLQILPFLERSWHVLLHIFRLSFVIRSKVVSIDFSSLQLQEIFAGFHVEKRIFILLKLSDQHIFVLFQRKFQVMLRIGWDRSWRLRRKGSINSCSWWSSCVPSWFFGISRFWRFWRRSRPKHFFIGDTEEFCLIDNRWEKVGNSWFLINLIIGFRRENVVYFGPFDLVVI